MPRAARGESSVQKGPDGRWHGYVSMGLTSEGKRQRRHVAAPLRRDVVAKVRELELHRDAGTVTTAGRSATVSQWLDHWLDTIAARKVRPLTLQGYRSKIRTRIAPNIGHHRLDKLQPEHVEQLYVKLEAQGLAPASILQCHRILSRALKVATQRGRVARNVCTLVDAPSAIRSEVEPLSAEDARALLDAAFGQPNAARWSVALALGLRQGEALGLRWGDVDLEQGSLRVRRTLQRHKGVGLVFSEPKSAAGRRSIALPRQLVEALRAHRQAQLEHRLLVGELWQDEDLLFAQATGRPIDPRRDWADWKALLRAAGVRDARLHDARHTAATLLLMQGVPARVAMQILGHSQISLTLGTYSHVVPELATEAAELMGAALWGDPVAPTGPNGTQVGTQRARRRVSR